MALVRRREPAWHRNLRKKRQRARTFIAGAPPFLSTRGIKKRVRDSVCLLGRHHTFNPLEFPGVIRSYINMTWHCQTCKINNGPKHTHCKQCYAHWTEVWQMPKRRSRSKSQNVRKKASKETTSEAESWAVFPEKVPWVVSTPMTRVSSKVGEASSASNRELDLPPQPVLPPPPTGQEHVSLTEDESKKLQSLRSLDSMGMELTEEMTRLLEQLTAKEQMAASAKALTHGHLNRLHKLRNQVSASAKKVVDLDKEWTAFIANTLNKVKEHAQMYQSCRADLLEVHNQKIAELLVVKKEMSEASMSLLGQTQPVAEIPDMPDPAESIQALQEAMNEGGAVGPIDLTAEMEEDEMEGFEQAGITSKATSKALKPFKGATSPTKVTNLHLKTKTESKELRKEDK